MIFTKNELKNNATEILTNKTLTNDDLLNDFAIGSGNKVLFPIARVEYEEFNPEINDYSITSEVVYNFEQLRQIKVKLDTIHRNRLMAINRDKYLYGNEKITNKFPYYGKKLLELNAYCKDNNSLQQQYLLDNDYKQIVVSHADCGYEYRGGDEELQYRDIIADYICDGNNDTEILQNVINSESDTNIEIMLLEDEYILKPTSGSGTEEDPYICLNIDRDNIILRSCDRKTNITFDRNIVKEGDICYLIAVNGNNVDISNICFALDELDIYYKEYKYPDPTEKMLEVKAYVESVDPEEKVYNKTQVLNLINSEI